MNEEVIISIKGLRVTEDTDEDVEVITPGKYYLKNGKHYLLYDSSKLCFQEEKSYQSIYSTMFGEFLMETKTDAVMLDESDEVIEATVKYELFINGSSVSTNNIVIKVENKVK